MNRRMLSLTPYDLPGYTGWARLAESIAPELHIHPIPTEIQVGRAVEFWIKCKEMTRACYGGAHLYIRFYGPAIQVPDRIIDHFNGSYSVITTFYDYGTWFMDATVEFSTAPSIVQRFPNASADVTYEGYPITNSPMVFMVNKGLPLNLAPCDTFQLNGLRGRWILKGRMKNSNEINSNLPLLGLKFQFRPYSCTLGSLQKTMQTCTSLVTIWDIVFVGDSTMGLQVESFIRQRHNNNMLNAWRLHQIDTNSGLRVRLDEISEKLSSIRSRYPNSNMAILFNAGLHDIDKYCGASENWIAWRKTMFGKDDILDCVDEYGKLMMKLKDIMQALSPKPLIVFRSTTAAWQKWGNWGFRWPIQPQPFTTSAAMVTRMNRKAFDTLDSTIKLIDGYHLTLSRPDHTQITNDQQTGKHLVHHGPEVNGVLNLIFIHFILSHTNVSEYTRCTHSRE